MGDQEKKSNEELYQRRLKIRAIDRHILELLRERMNCATDIASLKADLKLPIKDERVEQELLQENCQTAQKLGLDPQFAKDVTQLMVHHAVQVQTKKLLKN